MTANVSLTIKIDPTLKETLKSLALEHQVSLSQEVSQRLHASLAVVEASAVDNQETVEEVGAQLTGSEVKQLRALLKKTKKKK